MTPLEFIGAIAIGALSVLVALLGVVAYLTRGHRIDLTQVRAINVWEDLNRRKAFGPWRTVEKDADVKMPEPPDETPAQSAVSDMMRAGMQHGQATVRERGEDE